MRRKGKKQGRLLRLNLVFFFFSLSFLFILVALYSLQVIHGDEALEKAENMYFRGSHVFNRGLIYFQDGEEQSKIVVAGQKKLFLASVNPSKISREKFSHILDVFARYTQLNKEKVYQRFVHSPSRIYFEIMHQLEKKDLEKIQKDLKGKYVHFYPENKRIYPFHRSASHVLGFLAYDKKNQFKGVYGLEAFYNKVLERKKEKNYGNFFALAFHGLKNFLEEGNFREGDISSSIDIKIQMFLEKKLAEIHKKWKSKITGGIIMDPKTGEILAMASYPNFDPNNFQKEKISLFKNPSVSNVYEFGSVMKPLVMAIALDKGFVNAHTSYFDRGFVKVGKYTINNFDKRGRGKASMQDVLDQSLNTGMVFVSQKIPKHIFRDYFKKYGFQEKSGVDLPQDVKGLTENLKSNRDIEFAHMSYVQGIAIPPLSFMRAASALANNGETVIPHLINSIEYTDGLVYTQKEKLADRVFSPETAKEITRMLVHVFDHYRRGKVKFPHYQIAAKTGTAQLPNRSGGYDSNRHLHSFFAYFPASKPKFLVFLYTLEPQGVKYSSQTLLDPFRELAEYLIHYANIPPDR